MIIKNIEMMKLKYIPLLFAILLFFGCSQQSEPPRLEGWDYSWMENIKSDLNEGRKTFLLIFNQLIEDADKGCTGTWESQTSPHKRR